MGDNSISKKNENNKLNEEKVQEEINLGYYKLEENEQDSILNKYKEKVKHFIRKIDNFSYLKPAISAGTASFAQCLCFYWCDLGKNRLQAGLQVSFKDLIGYNGFSLSLIYIVAARSFGFLIFESSKRILQSYFKLNNQNVNETKIHFICATATAISKPFLLFPIETMKINMQVKKENISEAFRSMVNLPRKYKIKSLFYLQTKNFFAYFTWFETRKILKTFTNKNREKSWNLIKKYHNKAFLENFIIGSISALTSFICSSPFSTIKTLRQIGKDQGFRDLFFKEGKTRLHKGYQFHFINIVGGGGVFNLVYSLLMDHKAHF